MKDKDWTEAETSVNSPTLIRHTQRLSNAPNPNFLRTSFYSSPSPSQTEVEMYSHSIINEVMESSRYIFFNVDVSRFGIKSTK